MDLNKTALFGAVKHRLSWLTQRQEVLSQNIANADTPKFRPKDVEAFNFEDTLRSQRMQIGLARTDAAHLGGNRRRTTEFREETEHRPFETTPGGNAVVLEEQMAKVNETQVSHKLTTQLYKKHLGLIRMALGK